MKPHLPQKCFQEIEKELEDDKPEGEAALQELFNKIYRDADDDTRFLGTNLELVSIRWQ